MIFQALCRAVLGHLGAMLGHLGAMLSHLGAMLGTFGAILCHLEAIFNHLGAILSQFSKTIEKIYFSMFLVCRQCAVPQKIIKIRCHMDAKIDDQIDCLWDRLLDQLLTYVGANLASKNDPKSIKHQFQNEVEN